ncbi:MAG: hypothetical protein GYB41_16155 [Oceanospirillales bacterium]|nr:hypothetical protein [Oceanospirillales bacterium]
MTAPSRVLLTILLSALSLQVWGASCSTAQQTAWQHQTTEYRQQQQWAQAHTTLLQLSHCQPQRGDLRIELLRLALSSGNYTAALRHRQWLVENQVPPALLQLMDAWIEEARFANSQPTDQHTHSLSLKLSRGYDSNANDGSRHDTIGINFNGLPLTWSLDTASQEQASTLSAFSLNWQHQGTRTWNLGGSTRHYDKLQQTEFRLYGLLNQPIPCPAGLNCTLDLSLNGLKQEEQKQLQTQLGVSILGRTQRTSAYVRHTSDSIAPDSQSVGVQWLGRQSPSVMLLTGVEFDDPLEPRAGGAKTSVHVGTRLTPIPSLPLELNLLHLREFEQQAYSPAFWGDDRRNRRLSRVDGRYSWRLNSALTLKAQLQWRHTNSPIELYQQTGWLAELSITSTL